MSGMRVIQDGLQFCGDCSCWAANGDDSGIENDEYRKRVHEGVAQFGPHLVCSSEGPEYDNFECDSCGEYVYGGSNMFVVLGPEEWTCEPVPGAQHDGRHLLSEGKRVARVQSYGSSKHASLLAPRIVALLNAEPELDTLFDLVSDLLDSHPVDPEDECDGFSIETKVLHQLRVVKARLNRE